MSFSTAIRRSLTPLAARLLAGQRGLHHGNLLIATRKTGLFSGSPRYSSSTSVVKRLASDTSLLQLIDSEIDCCEQSLKEDKGVPEGFAFQINDNLGQQTVSLTRELEGETIHVDVEPSDLITGKNKASSQSTLPMVVKVSKPGAPGFEFGITVYFNRIVIDSLTVKDPDLIEGQEPYEAPAFDELDGKMQQALYKYLEVRGITASATNFLHMYTVSKQDKEYAHWLKNLQKHVAA